jgi:hypothetical protein
MGQGVGARLFADAVAALRADGARQLRIASDPFAVGFYRRMGARLVGEVPSTPRGRTLPLLVFELEPASGRRIRFEAVTGRPVRATLEGWTPRLQPETRGYIYRRGSVNRWPPFRRAQTCVQQ